MLEAIEERELAYHLGLAPGAPDCGMTRGLPRMIPALMAPGLTRRRLAPVRRDMRGGKQRLEHALAQDVDVFVALDGRCTRTTGRALKQLGGRGCGGRVRDTEEDDESPASAGPS